MKKQASLFISIVFLMLASCTASKETTHEKIVQRNAGYPAPPPMDNSQPEGPSHGGGGAGKNGKPLESYQINIRQRPEYKKHLDPIFLNLSKSFPRLAADLLHIAEERTWYMIPGPLKKLPAEVMGLTEFIDFDQLAFQDLNEIWVDSSPYQEKMQSSDQANLLLHEMVMGVRLLEFADALDKCLAEAKIFMLDEKTYGKYRDARKYCFTNYPRLSPQKPKLELNDEDYSSIRALVGDLMESQGQVDAEIMGSWLASHGFRAYK